MAHTFIPPLRCTAVTLELTHKGNINDETILERDREVRYFNVTLLASAIARCRHLVIDTLRTDLGVTRQGCHYIHEMIVTANRTCVLFKRHQKLFFWNRSKNSLFCLVAIFKVENIDLFESIFSFGKKSQSI